MPIKVKLVDNSSEVGVGVGSYATVKLFKEALKKEEQERTEADAYLQKEISNILASGACYLLITENKNGSIDVSILNKKEEVLSTKTITLTEKLIKNVRLDYDTGQLVFTHFDDTTSTCDINAIKKAITAETTRATARENELENNKLDKVTSTQPNNKTRLYVINADGSQGTTILDENSTAALTIPLRTNNGNITVPLIPGQNSDAVSKEYVDTYSGKIDSISLDGTALTIDTNKNVDIPVSLTTTTGSEAITVNSDSLNVVTRNTDQTISGVKTFKNRPIFDDGASFYGSDQAPLSVTFSSEESAVDFSIMASDIHYWLNVEDPETDNMHYTVSLPAKDGVLAVQGKSVIEKVSSLADVPNEELGYLDMQKT